jgi:putative transposase
MSPLLDLVGDWKAFLSKVVTQPMEVFEVHERTGRPLGDESFIDKASNIVGRDLTRKKSGPKVKDH